MPKTRAEGKEKYSMIKIPKSLADEIDQQMGQHGYRSRAEFAKDAIRSLLLNYGPLIAIPRFTHINTYGDHATIRDNKIGRAINIYFKNPRGTYCEFCKESACEHINYALTLPEVTEPLEERGWERKS